MAQAGKLALRGQQRTELLEWYSNNYSIGPGDGCKLRMYPFVINIQDAQDRTINLIVRADETMKSGIIAGSRSKDYKNLQTASFVCNFDIQDSEDIESEEDYVFHADFSSDYAANEPYSKHDKGTIHSKNGLMMIADQAYLIFRAAMKLLEVSNGKEFLEQIAPTWLAKKEKKNRKKAVKAKDRSEILLTFYGDRNMCAILPDGKTPTEVLGYDIPIMIGEEKPSQVLEAVEPEQEEPQSESNRIFERFILSDKNVVDALMRKVNAKMRKVGKLIRTTFPVRMVPLSEMEIIYPSESPDKFFVFRLTLKYDDIIHLDVAKADKTLDEIENREVEFIHDSIVGKITHGASPIAWRMPSTHPWRDRSMFWKAHGLLDCVAATFYGVNKILEEMGEKEKRDEPNQLTLDDTTPEDIDNYHGTLREIISETITEALHKKPIVHIVSIDKNGRLAFRINPSFSENTSGRGGYQHTHEYTRRGCWVHMKNGKVYWRRESVCCKGRGPRVQKTTIIKES